MCGFVSSESAADYRRMLAGTTKVMHKEFLQPGLLLRAQFYQDHPSCISISSIISTTRTTLVLKVSRDSRLGRCGLYSEELYSTWVEVQFRLVVNQRPDVWYKELLGPRLFHIAELQLRKFLPQNNYNDVVKIYTTNTIKYHSLFVKH